MNLCVDTGGHKEAIDKLDAQVTGLQGLAAATYQETPQGAERPLSSSLQEQVKLIGLFEELNHH